jgi:hypothetical protein
MNNEMEQRLLASKVAVLFRPTTHVKEAIAAIGAFGLANLILRQTTGSSCTYILKSACIKTTLTDKELRN